MMNYDQDFLKALDEHHGRTIHARIIALTLDEYPIESIEGRVTQGSINIDGTSSVRRTCSLTMVANDYNYNAFLWGLNTKFKLEIGLENTIDSSYPQIIWFKQGVYFISSFSTSHSTKDFTISIQGKDKMCALNGELGGVLTSSVDFGTVEDIQTTKITKLTLKEIIRNAVHLYGGEPLHNIIINDLDFSGLELLEYRYDKPMYLYRGVNSTYFDNVTLDGNKQCKIGVWSKDENGNEIISQWLAFINEEGKRYTTLADDVRPIQLSDLSSSDLEMLVNPMTGTNKPNVIKIDDQNWYIAKISYGETAGYRFTDLVYPGDLIGGVGETLTSILDKIKNMLGAYEYFYDLDGHFIFQRRPSSNQIIWTPEETIKSISSVKSDIVYTFSNGVLVTSFNNTPDIANVKNDYSVWGEKQGLSGKPIAVHMRYAIDEKPVRYISLDGTEYNSDTYDWRELIYQMAIDYFANTNNDNYMSTLIAKNMPYYTNGRTGYENYYTDIVKWWRQLYDPFTEEKILAQQQKCEDEILECERVINDNKSTVSEQNEAKANKKEWEKKLDACVSDLKNFQAQYFSKDENHSYWNKIVYEAPQNLTFWFDFLDTQATLASYSVKNIGCRPKAINDSNVKAIYFRETPNVIFTTDYKTDSSSSGAYTYINAEKARMNTMFSISAQGKSAKTAIDDLMYEHGYCTETATINTIPIYYLEPNHKIYVVDHETKINGYYNITKLSIPMTYNGIMSITATKVVNNN